MADSSTTPAEARRSRASGEPMAGGRFVNLSVGGWVAVAPPLRGGVSCCGAALVWLQNHGSSSRKKSMACSKGRPESSLQERRRRSQGVTFPFSLSEVRRSVGDAGADFVLAVVVRTYAAAANELAGRSCLAEPAVAIALVVVETGTRSKEVEEEEVVVVVVVVEEEEGDLLEVSVGVGTAAIRCETICCRPTPQPNAGAATEGTVAAEFGIAAVDSVAFAAASSCDDNVRVSGAATGCCVTGDDVTTTRSLPTILRADDGLVLRTRGGGGGGVIV